MTHQPDNKTIEFERISLTLTGQPLAKGKAVPGKEIEAFAGKGSGLAFHMVFAEVEEKPESDDDFLEDEGGEGDRYGFAVTQVRSGMCLGQGRVDTPRQAKRWVEILSKLADWNKDINELVKGPARSARLKELAAGVEQARLEAIEQCLFIESF